MTVKKLYICDRCGDRQEGENKYFYNLEFCAKTVGSYMKVDQRSVDVCGSCAKFLGCLIFEEKISHEEKLKSAPTVEDLVKQIIEMCSDKED